MSAHYKGSSQGLSSLRQDTQGKVVIKPKYLDVIWGNDERYWRGLKSSNPDEPAELLQVCWLEVTGSCPMDRLRKCTHKVSFEVSMKPDAFGWSESPVYLMVKIGDKYTWRKADLSQLGNQRVIPYANKPLTFDVPSDANGNVDFGLYEIWRGRWKGGLVIHRVIIEPVS